jgi:hypothetical protein
MIGVVCLKKSKKCITDVGGETIWMIYSRKIVKQMKECIER